MIFQGIFFNFLIEQDLLNREGFIDSLYMRMSRGNQLSVDLSRNGKVHTEPSYPIPAMLH